MGSIKDLLASNPELHELMKGTLDGASKCIVANVDACSLLSDGDKGVFIVNVLVNLTGNLLLQLTVDPENIDESFEEFVIAMGVWLDSAKRNGVTKKEIH